MSLGRYLYPLVRPPWASHTISCSPSAGLPSGTIGNFYGANHRYASAQVVHRYPRAAGRARRARARPARGGDLGNRNETRCSYKERNVAVTTYPRCYVGPIAYPRYHQGLERRSRPLTIYFGENEFFGGNSGIDRY